QDGVAWRLVHQQHIKAGAAQRHRAAMTDLAARRIPPRGKISHRGTMALSGARFDVLLMHESPRDAILAGSGSEEIGAVIGCTRPAFAFFGHYHGTGRRVEGSF